MSQRIHYRWGQFDKDIKIIVRRLQRRRKKFDGVWGPSRGGLVPAVMLSHYLDLPLKKRPTPKTLIVDDIADTGKRLKRYAQRNYFIVTIFYHRQSRVVPDIWLREKKKKWIVFPWEVG